VLGLAEAVARAVGREPRILYMSSTGGATRLAPDIARAKSLLGWEPTVPLEEGVGHTVAWFRFRPGAP